MSENAQAQRLHVHSTDFYTPSSRGSLAHAQLLVLSSAIGGTLSGAAVNRRCCTGACHSMEETVDACQGGGVVTQVRHLLVTRGCAAMYSTVTAASSVDTG